MILVSIRGSWEYELFISSLILGILTLVLALIGICLTFILFIKERFDRFQAQIKNNLNQNLEREQDAFNSLGEALSHRNEVQFQSNLNFYDVVTKMCLDSLNPLVFFSQHTDLENHSYKHMMINTFKNSLSIALERLTISLKVNQNALNEATKEHNQRLKQILTTRIAYEKNEFSLKQKEVLNLKKNSRQELWKETSQALMTFRELFSGLLQSLIDSYTNFQMEEKKDSHAWRQLDLTYQKAQFYYRELRGNIESVFVDF